MGEQMFLTKRDIIVFDEGLSKGHNIPVFLFLVILLSSLLPTLAFPEKESEIPSVMGDSSFTGRGEEEGSEERWWNQTDFDCPSASIEAVPYTAYNLPEEVKSWVTDYPSTFGQEVDPRLHEGYNLVKHSFHRYRAMGVPSESSYTALSIFTNGSHLIDYYVVDKGTDFELVDFSHFVSFSSTGEIALVGMDIQGAEELVAGGWQNVDKHSLFAKCGAFNQTTRDMKRIDEIAVDELLPTPAGVGGIDGRHLLITLVATFAINGDEVTENISSPFSINITIEIAPLSIEGIHYPLSQNYLQSTQYEYIDTIGSQYFNITLDDPRIIENEDTTPSYYCSRHPADGWVNVSSLDNSTIHNTTVTKVGSGIWNLSIEWDASWLSETPNVYLIESLCEIIIILVKFNEFSQENTWNITWPDVNEDIYGRLGRVVEFNDDFFTPHMREDAECWYIPVIVDVSSPSIESIISNSTLLDEYGYRCGNGYLKIEGNYWNGHDGLVFFGNRDKDGNWTDGYVGGLSLGNLRARLAGMEGKEPSVETRQNRLHVDNDTFAWWWLIPATLFPDEPGRAGDSNHDQPLILTTSQLETFVMDCDQDYHLIQIEGVENLQNLNTSNGDWEMNEEGDGWTHQLLKPEGLGLVWEGEFNESEWHLETHWGVVNAPRVVIVDGEGRMVATANTRLRYVGLAEPECSHIPWLEEASASEYLEGITLLAVVSGLCGISAILGILAILRAQRPKSDFYENGDANANKSDH